MVRFEVKGLGHKVDIQVPGLSSSVVNGAIYSENAGGASFRKQGR